VGATGDQRAGEGRAKAPSAWSRLVSLVVGPRRDVAVTGAAGVGKSVLLDAMRGTIGQGYERPHESQRLERGTVSHDGQRMAFSVVPGQPTTPRFLSLDKVFDAKTPPCGVIHVVADGFVTLRNETRRQAEFEAGAKSLAQYRERQRATELEELDEVCERVRRLLRAGTQPSWMVVAVAKYDLLAHDPAAAMRRYDPSGDGPFVARMRRLAEQVGTDRFAWTAEPVCARPEDFDWFGETQVRALDEAQRDVVLRSFLDAVASWCEREVAK